LFTDRANLLSYLPEFLKPGDVLVTLGAGDIWKVGQELVSGKGT
jgi:UDP-N-acetylmuramate--alanine ligase